MTSAPRRSDVLHRGFANGSYPARARTTLTIGENVAYGHRDFRPLAPQPQDPAQKRCPPSWTRSSRNSVSSLSAMGHRGRTCQVLAPGVVLRVHGSYGASGGADAVARRRFRCSTVQRLVRVRACSSTVAIRIGISRAPCARLWSGHLSTLVSGSQGIRSPRSGGHAGNARPAPSLSRDEIGGVTSVARSPRPTGGRSRQ